MEIPTAIPARPADSSTRATRVLNWLLQKLPTRQREKALDYLVLIRMDHPIGALLLLWPTGLKSVSGTRVTTWGLR